MINRYIMNKYICLRKIKMEAIISITSTIKENLERIRPNTKLWYTLRNLWGWNAPCRLTYFRPTSGNGLPCKIEWLSYNTMSPGSMDTLYALPACDMTSTGHGSSRSWATWMMADETRGSRSTSWRIESKILEKCNSLCAYRKIRCGRNMETRQWVS